MKKYLTLLLLIVSIGIKAQTVQITSKFLGDHIWLNRGAVEVSPLPTGSGMDSIRSYDWSISPGRDTLGIMTIQINYYNKASGLIYSDRIGISQTLYPGKWSTMVNAVDTFILNQRKRLIR